VARQVGDNGRSKASSRVRDVTKGARILALVASGQTVTAAVDAVGGSRRHGSQLYIRELQRVLESSNDLRREMIAQDLESLRLLMAAHMPLALGQTLAFDDSGEVIEDLKGRDIVDLRHVVAVPPSYQSAKIVMSVLDRRAKLLGLDSAVKVEISQGRVNDTVDEIAALIDDATDDGLAAVLEIDPARRDVG
jgi:hypothetical protein